MAYTDSEFQKNQTGVEARIATPSSRERQLFQKNQTGVEAWENLARIRGISSFRRTRLVLKHRDRRAAGLPDRGFQKNQTGVEARGSHVRVFLRG